MTKTRKIEHQLLEEFRKLSHEAKGEVLAYTKWMRDIEATERVRESLGRMEALTGRGIRNAERED